MTGATIIFYMVLIFPGQHPPVKMDKPSASLEECLDDAAYVLGKMNPDWPNGTRLQAGCFITVPNKEEVNK